MTRVLFGHVQWNSGVGRLIAKMWTWGDGFEVDAFASVGIALECVEIEY